MRIIELFPVGGRVKRPAAVMLPALRYRLSAWLYALLCPPTVQMA